MGHAYDFDSVMHYGKFAFAKDRKYTRRELTIFKFMSAYR